MQTIYNNTSNYANTTLNNRYLEYYNPPLKKEELSDLTLTIILKVY